jgi:hypothetical protein
MAAGAQPERRIDGRETGAEQHDEFVRIGRHERARCPGGGEKTLRCARRIGDARPRCRFGVSDCHNEGAGIDRGPVRTRDAHAVTARLAIGRGAAHLAKAIAGGGAQAMRNRIEIAPVCRAFAGEARRAGVALEPARVAIGTGGCEQRRIFERAAGGEFAQDQRKWRHPVGLDGRSDRCNDSGVGKRAGRQHVG